MSQPPVSTPPTAPDGARETGVRNLDLLEAPGRSPAETRHVETVRAILLGFSRSDFSVLYAALAPEPEIRIIGLTPEKLGRHANNPALVPETFSNGMLFTVRQCVAEGERVAVEWDDVAVTSGGLLYENSGLSLFRFDAEGRIASYHEYLDPDRFVAILPRD